MPSPEDRLNTQTLDKDHGSRQRSETSSCWQAENDGRRCQGGATPLAADCTETANRLSAVLSLSRGRFRASVRTVQAPSFTAQGTERSAASTSSVLGQSAPEQPSLVAG